MRTYSWWKRHKKRMQKKYKLYKGWYLSPKEVKEFYKRYKENKQCH